MDDNPQDEIKEAYRDIKKEMKSKMAVYDGMTADEILNDIEAGIVAIGSRIDVEEVKKIINSTDYDAEGSFKIGIINLYAYLMTRRRDKIIS